MLAIEAGNFKKSEDDSRIRWIVEPHVCRECFGRLASRPLGGGLIMVMCTNCGIERTVVDITDACCCGIKMRKSNNSGRTGGAMVDAGIRCIENPRRSAAFPALYVAAEVNNGRK